MTDSLVKDLLYILIVLHNVLLYFYKNNKIAREILKYHESSVMS